MGAPPDDFAALIGRHFRLAPARTQRQDQWYKRSHQAWRLDRRDGEGDILILAPATPAAEWATALRRFAARFAVAIRDAPPPRSNDTTPSLGGDKLFPDSVFDQASSSLLCSDAETSPERTRRDILAAQRLSYWLPPIGPTSVFERQRRAAHLAAAVAMLLEHGQTAALERLAANPDVDLADLFRGQPHRGWETAAEDALETWLLLGILACFPAELDLKGGDRGGRGGRGRLDRWLPLVGFVTQRPSTTRLLGQLRNESRTTSRTDRGGGAGGDRDHAFDVLCACHRLMSLCGIDPGWEGRIAEAALHFVGFEAWNRMREGSGYLGCDLNFRKSDSWLRAAGNGGGVDREQEQMEENEEDEAVRRAAAVAVTSARLPRRDPLLLRPPSGGRESSDYDNDYEDEDEDGAGEGLAALEAEEAAYGARRSFKYQRRRS